MEKKEIIPNGATLQAEDGKTMEEQLAAIKLDVENFDDKMGITPKIYPNLDVQKADQKLIEEAQKAAKGKFDPVDVEKALNDVYDVEERALIQFILLGDAAKACRENKQAFVDCIELAMPASALTKEVKGYFKTWNFEERPYGYEYFFSPPVKWEVKIPVRIYVYKEKFKLFDNPNRVWGTTEGFNIPNPFDSYWKARHFIRAKLKKGMPLSSQTL